MRKILSVFLAFAMLFSVMCISASAEETDADADAVFSLNLLEEDDNYAVVSVRLDSGSFNSVDLRFDAVSSKIEDCVYTDESDEFYTFLRDVKRDGGAVMSIPYAQPGKYGFATTTAYDHIGEDIIICKFLKAVPDTVSVDDISLTVFSCTDDSGNSLSTSVVSNLPIIEDGHQHDYVTIVNTVTETCCQDGYVLYQCSCGRMYTEVIPAHGHTLLHMSSDVSCTKSGMEFDICTECMDIFNKQTIQPSGHSFGEWEITAIPDAKVSGKAERTCVSCDEKETVELEAVLHDCYVDGTTVSGIRPGMTAEEFKENYVNDENAQIIITPYIGDRIGTGTTVTAIYSEGIAVTYTVLLYGDVTGDGWYDAQDAVFVSFIMNGMLNESTLGREAFAAADCNRDGLTDGTDVEVLNQAGVLLTPIDQTKPSDELLDTSSAYAEYSELISQDTAVEEAEEKEDFCILAFIVRIINYIRLCLSILNLR